MRLPCGRCGELRCLQIVGTLLVVCTVIFLLSKDLTMVVNKKTIRPIAWHRTTEVFNATRSVSKLKRTNLKARKTPILSDLKKQETYKKTEWYKSAMEIQQDWKFRPVDYLCRNITLVGNWPVCFDPPLRMKEPCLVYSFGIAFDFSFDDGMRKIGCEVHSFDPSMNMKDKITETGVHFHNLGLGAINNDKFLPRKDSYVQNQQTWKLRTLKKVLEELDHIGKTLDVLKIDIESHEWNVVDNIMKDGLFKNVKQFLLEWHLFPDFPPRSDFKRCSKIYRRLIDSGLKKYFTSEHPQTFTPAQFNIQADTAHVNVKFINDPHR